MTYVQFLELFAMVLLVLPVIGNIGVLVFKESHPRVAYFFFRMTAIAIAVAKEPKDRQVAAAGAALIDEVKQSPIIESVPVSIAVAVLEQKIQAAAPGVAPAAPVEAPK